MTRRTFPNRFLRAMRRKDEQAKTRRDTVTDQSITEASRPQGAGDPRMKSSGHGQKTADKWNQ
jgi:hypothetical protein